jgi:uncharacterized protein (DUF2147 family)
MRKAACTAIIFLGSLGAAHAADPLGEWLVEDKVATIKIVDCSGHLWGVVGSEKTPGGTDTNNPDKTKRSRPTLGMPILLDMKADKDEKDKWDGHIYNAKDGKTYEASIQVTSPNQLKVEGCVLGFLCGGQTWTRVEPPAGTALPGGAKTSATTPGTRMAAPSTMGGKMAGPNPAGVPHTTGQKVAPGAMAPGGATAELDPVCMLPEVTGAAH